MKRSAVVLTYGSTGPVATCRNLCDGAWGEIENCIAALRGYAHDDGYRLDDGLCRGSAGNDFARCRLHTRSHGRAWTVGIGHRSSSGRTSLGATQAEPHRPPESIDNAITAQFTIAGSTNAIVHIIALAGLAGLPLTLDRFDELSRRVPVLGDIRPSGRYLMEDMYDAGGLGRRSIKSKIC